MAGEGQFYLRLFYRLPCYGVGYGTLITAVLTGAFLYNTCFLRVKRIKQILPILKDLLSNASSGSECERDDIYAHTLDLMYAVEKYLDDND